MTGTIDRPQELIIAQANAIVDQCYFVDINAAGRLGNGRSIVVGPEGEVIYVASESAAQIVFNVDLNRVRESRKLGIQRLGQVLKSFRDTPIEYPCYRGEFRESAAMTSLGPLSMPK